MADDLNLIAFHNAIRFSGLFAKYTAQRWGLRHLADLAQRVMTELVTRAVETTGNPDPRLRHIDVEELQAIRIRVSTLGSTLLVEVWDSDPTPPELGDACLSTIDELCQRWDCYGPTRGGKVIRAEIEAPQQHGQLPQRTAGQFPYPALDTPAQPSRDTPLMRRVLDGLSALDAGTTTQ